MLRLPTACYLDQHKTWPQTGKHILAQSDEETVIVYQAYRSAIGKFAVQNGYFGGQFKYTRMSWIKPNFLWMMYRSAWGTAEGQEVILGIRLRKTFFDSLLDQCVPSSFPEGSEQFKDRDDWQKAVKQSDVRLQWDPDHLPTGEKCERRAVQLGIRGNTLEEYGKKEILEIIDLSEFVAEQRNFAPTWEDGNLHTPVERPYLPERTSTAKKIGIDLFE